MPVPANPFKRPLRAKHPQIGLWSSLASHVPVEVVAGAGFDWLLLDMEHAPNELPMICILSTHHAIADGMSVAFVVRDLLQALAGATLQPLPVLPAYDDLVGQSVTGNGRKPMVAGLDLPALGRPAVYRNRDGAVPQITMLGFVPEFVTRLRERARVEGTTVHGALCSGLALTFAQVRERPAGEPVRIWSPMDVRRLLGLGDDCTLLALSMIVPAEPRGLRGFWEVARAISARLSATRTVEYLGAALSLLSQSIGRLDLFYLSF